MDIHKHASAIGRRRIAARLNVVPNTVGEAVRSGLYPAAWYPAVLELGLAAGVETPASLFRWKGRASLAPINAMTLPEPVPPSNQPDALAQGDAA